MFDTMIHLGALTGIALLTAAASATPMAQSSAAVTVPLPQINGETFLLRTQHNQPNEGSSLDGLYVKFLHNGAGRGDALLTTDRSAATPGFLNDSSLGFDIGSPYTFAFMSLAPDSVEVVDKNAVSIDPGSTSNTGFHFEGGILTTSAPNFGTFLACSGIHDGLPQLYYVSSEHMSPIAPANCTGVDLMEEVENTS